MNIDQLEQLDDLLRDFEKYVEKQSHNDNSSFVESDYRKVCGATDLVNDALMELDAD